MGYNGSSMAAKAINDIVTECRVTCCYGMYYDKRQDLAVTRKRSPGKCSRTAIAVVQRANGVCRDVHTAVVTSLSAPLRCMKGDIDCAATV